MTKSTDIDGLLREIGLTDKETTVYLEILRRGRLTPSQIAEATGINRSSTYVVLAGLVKKGLVYEEVGPKTAHFVAKPVDELDSLYLEDQRNLDRKKKLISAAIEELERYPKHVDQAPPKVRYVGEAELEGFLFERMKEWNRSATAFDSTCWGYQDHGFVERYRKWVVWASKEFRIRICLLSETSSAEESLKRTYGDWRKTRQLKKRIDFATSVWVMGEYVMILSTRERPFYLVEIRDAVLAHNMRELFRRLWNEADASHS